LKVWQKAHRLAVAAYRQTASFPRSEVYGLTSQIRRAAVSTPANIVEGSKRRSRADFRHFLYIAQGSNEEVKYLLALAAELGYLAPSSVSELSALADEVGAMLHAIAIKLNSDH
jgi:four helix bundle protein